jgi:hypothetical protein
MMTRERCLETKFVVQRFCDEPCDFDPACRAFFERAGKASVGLKLSTLIELLKSPRDGCSEKCLRVFQEAQFQKFAHREETMDGGLRDYSVLLLYPDERMDGTHETFLEHIEAVSREEAVLKARTMASKANKDSIPPEDFEPIAVFKGQVDME